MIDKETNNYIIDNVDIILNYKNEKWNNIKLDIKIKILHHYLNYFSTKQNNKNISWNIISIPLKSLKPKKIIQFMNFNKQNNKDLFNIFNKNILDYTFDFRNKYLLAKNTKKYYVFSNLPKEEYNNILNGYNEIIYKFMTTNIDKININNLFNDLVSNNKDKLILENMNFSTININYQDNGLKIIFDNNIEIFLELILYSDKITNNIPVKYLIKLNNKF